MAQMQSFAPGFGSGLAVASTATSAVSEMRGATSTALCLTNLGSHTVYVRTGYDGEVATAADYPVLAGQQVSITINASHTHVAYLSATGNTDLHVMRGEGI